MRKVCADISPNTPVQVKRRNVESAPALISQGCVGWNVQSRTPRLSCCLCPRRTFTGTINGFCMKSLKCKEKIKRSDVSTLTIMGTSQRDPLTEYLSVCLICTTKT